jgi:hypothetical protein
VGSGIPFDMFTGKRVTWLFFFYSSLYYSVKLRGLHGVAF